MGVCILICVLSFPSPIPTKMCSSHHGVSTDTMLWSFDPTGLQYSLEMIYDRYRRPIMVVENGLGAFDTVEDGQIHDDYRINYFKPHIEAMANAIAIHKAMVQRL